ncbi:hypothetical protein Vi05172_g13244 [Venturia inaequalis]|uniref:DUF7730 domain-containing protein n=1 Tax=Venturia inaequalis TaxID=5025 RepID=A0A8H3YYQ3_VENIN|nr:hypothetical protein EG327_007282 [Venturia inaequalis]RDI76767.1 hypothetical protein Vi05172_g13244 [Venturia inaequalis]
MPNPKNEFGFKREHTTKAFLVPDSLPSNSNMSSKPEITKLSSASIALQSVVVHATNEVHQQSQSAFMNLPLEIRLRIYGLLVIGWFDPKTNRSCVVDTKNQKMVFFGFGQFRQNRTKETAVLQTCKRIHVGGTPELYSKNVFRINKAAQFQRFVIQIGPVNLKLIRHLDIWISYSSNPDGWPPLFKFLANNATGLRHIKVAFDAETEWFMGIGLGCDVDLVRALGKIQGLAEFIIEGFYSKHWPAYLEKSMGCKVTALCGHCCEMHELDDEALTEEELKERIGWNEIHLKENKKIRRYFEKYQVEAGEMNVAPGN